MVHNATKTVAGMPRYRPGYAGAGAVQPYSGAKRARSGAYIVDHRRAAFGSGSAAAAAAAFSGRGGAAVMDRLRKSSGEKKGVDTIMGGVVQKETDNNNGFFTPNVIAPGNGSFNRVGRKVYCKSLRIKGNFHSVHALEAGSTLSNTLRMVVVWDKQPSGVLPLFNTIFGNTVQSGIESATGILDPPRYDNMSRFQVLREKTWDLNPGGAAGSADTLQIHCSIDEYIKLGSRETVYAGESATSTIADISSGALYVIFRAFHEQTIGLTQVILNNVIARLRYTD